MMSGSLLTLISHFFAHFGQFSKRLSYFQHSYLSQMTTKNENKYNNFENSSFVMDFTLDQTGVAFWVSR